MGVFSALFFLGGIAAHTSLPSILPFPLKFLAPSIGWLFTSITLADVRPFLYSVVFGIQAVLTAWGYTKYGRANPFLVRLVFCPFAATVIGGLLSIVIPFSNNKIVNVLLMLIQLWSCLGGVIMLFVYPASTIQFIVPQKKREFIYQNTHSHLVNQLDKRIERFYVPVEGGMVLDTLTVKQPYQTSRWVMYLGGNAEFLENSLFETSIFADYLRANLLLFNPRGIGRSTGYITKVSDLVEDAATVVQHLLKRERIREREFILFGHSIGGSVAVQIARWVLPKSIIVLDRCFSSLSDVATSFSFFSPSITRFILPLCIGELDTIACWDAIKHDRKLILYAAKDEIIIYQNASIARFPKFHEGGSEHKFVIELHGDEVPTWHNSPLSAFAEKNTVVALLNRFLESS